MKTKFIFSILILLTVFSCNKEQQESTVNRNSPEPSFSTFSGFEMEEEYTFYSKIPGINPYDSVFKITLELVDTVVEVTIEVTDQYTESRVMSYIFVDQDIDTSFDDRLEIDVNQANIWIIDIKDCYLNNGTPDKPSCSGFTIACQCNDGKGNDCKRTSQYDEVCGCWDYWCVKGINYPCECACTTKVTGTNSSYSANGPALIIEADCIKYKNTFYTP
jgi:hypothetical protein